MGGAVLPGASSIYLQALAAPGRTASDASVLKRHTGAKPGREAREMPYLLAQCDVARCAPFCSSCFSDQLEDTGPRKTGNFHWSCAPLFPGGTVQGTTQKGYGKSAHSCHSHFPTWLCRECAMQSHLATAVVAVE